MQPDDSVSYSARPAPDERPWSARRLPALALIAAALIVKLAYFVALDRPLGCDCGRIWALPDNPQMNSRVMLDPYTLMHVATGGLLMTFLLWIKPWWSVWALLAAAFVSSTIWEIVENLPMTIELFNYDHGSPLDYRGDSILNAMADGAAVVLGALAALRLPRRGIIALVLAIEIGLTLWIRDGFSLGTLRALGLWS